MAVISIESKEFNHADNVVEFKNDDMHIEVWRINPITDKYAAIITRNEEVEVTFFEGFDKIETLKQLM